MTTPGPPDRYAPRARCFRTAIGAVTVALATISLACAGDPQPPVLWTAPPFALVDQTGDTLRADDLQGTVWVASFVFTHCADVCPTITARMARLRDSLRAEDLLGEVRLVSFTVDPARDTPEVLAAYATRYGRSPPSEWAFLTGSPPETTWRMIQTGFRLTAMPMEGEPHPTIGYQIAHAPRLVLVDREGRVRGTYETTDAGAMNSLRADLGRVLE